MTKAEQETIIRWDQEERVAHLWTAYEPDAQHWIRAGYPVRVSGSDRQGRPSGWAVAVQPTPFVGGVSRVEEWYGAKGIERGSSSLSAPMN
jgi:hypothetical protein